MTQRRLSILSTSTDHTTALAALLAHEISAGDLILLQGDVGAGKTHFARALIQHLLGTTEDVPSPTFTLVQTYPMASCDIWHADLYRLHSIQEIEELGLADAFETDICLVEWPDRLGPLMPDHGLDLTFMAGPGDDQRMLSLSWSDPKWDDKMAAWTK